MPASASSISRRQARRGRWAGLRGSTKVWILVGAVTVAATLAALVAVKLPPPDTSVIVPWWALLLAFYAAEFAVVHLRFRRDAHSFSMSEIPLVVGLFFASPLALILSQAAANGLVMTMHRRIPPLKVAFNLAQFAMQTTLAIIVFRQISRLGEPQGPAGWVAATLAVLAALAVADVLINAAIRLSGGRLDRGRCSRFSSSARSRR